MAWGATRDKCEGAWLRREGVGHRGKAGLQVTPVQPPLTPPVDVGLAALASLVILRRVLTLLLRVGTFAVPSVLMGGLWGRLTPTTEHAQLLARAEL